MRPSKEPCRNHREQGWWLSIYGVWVCSICHPAPSPDLVTREVKDAGEELRCGLCGGRMLTARTCSEVVTWCPSCDPDRTARIRGSREDEGRD